MKMFSNYNKPAKKWLRVTRDLWAALMALATVYMIFFHVGEDAVLFIEGNLVFMQVGLNYICAKTGDLDNMDRTVKEQVEVETILKQETPDVIQG